MDRPLHETTRGAIDRRKHSLESPVYGFHFESIAAINKHLAPQDRVGKVIGRHDRVSKYRLAACESITRFWASEDL
jgi:hypothetical protein